jgi:hypothetical protein
MNKNWDEMVFNISDGNASEMMVLKKFDIADFFEFVDNKTKKQ